jgi:hypothetical protein
LRVPRCSYFPYPAKVWVNGHEWAKRQMAKAGIGFTELSNGFASCEDPAALQAACDRLGPGNISVFFERWMSRIPLPLDQSDRDAGYWWELPVPQAGVSRTIVFDAPASARAFFDAPGRRQPRPRPARGRRDALRPRPQGPGRPALDRAPQPARPPSTGTRTWDRGRPR